MLKDSEDNLHADSVDVWIKTIQRCLQKKYKRDIQTKRSRQCMTAGSGGSLVGEGEAGLDRTADETFFVSCACDRQKRCGRLGD
jgi:hypothetical protein